MSFRSSRTENKAVTKNCKFCKDAGKSVEEYTSHFIRATMDPNSRIVCPTLLAIECRFCFQLGHTVSKCKKLASRGKNVQDAPVKKSYDKQERVQVVNPFDLLSEMGDSDDEEEATIGSSDAMSCMDCDTVSTGSTLVMTYAQMLNKPVPMAEASHEDAYSRLSLVKKTRYMRSWADDSDSDEE